MAAGGSAVGSRMQDFGVPMAAVRPHKHPKLEVQVETSLCAISSVPSMPHFPPVSAAHPSVVRFRNQTVRFLELERAFSGNDRAFSGNDRAFFPGKRTVRFRIILVITRV